MTEHKEEVLKEHKKHVNMIRTTKSPFGWQIATAVLALMFVLSLFYGGTFSVSTGEQDEIIADTLDYINTNLLAGLATANLDSVSEEYGMYKLEITVNGQEYVSYVTKDGKKLMPTVIDIEEIEETTKTEEVETGITKTDVPVVEAFVMSHCPYGTQMEKGLLPVVEVLGDAIDFEIKFVYYAMHGETEVIEQLNQYCIQKEQNELFNDYLMCFLEDGDSERCLIETGIDRGALETCTLAADEEFEISKYLNDESTWLSGRFPLFTIYQDENEKYGIAGSPSLVINGQSVSSSRDSASLLATICSAFNEKPEACNLELDSTSPSAGFGFSGSGSTSDAGCGA